MWIEALMYGLAHDDNHLLVTHLDGFMHNLHLLSCGLAATNDMLLSMMDHSTLLSTALLKIWCGFHRYHQAMICGKPFMLRAKQLRSRPQASERFSSWTCVYVESCPVTLLSCTR
jgi:hypothetical protein